MFVDNLELKYLNGKYGMLSYNPIKISLDDYDVPVTAGKFFLMEDDLKVKYWAIIIQ